MCLHYSMPSGNHDPTQRFPSWARHTLKVESKPAWDHKIKDAEERELPLSESLLSQLRAFRLVHPDVHLVFGKRGGKVDAPDGHLLRRLKVAVRNAGLNYTLCASCFKTSECEEWFLHRFRATFCTTLLRSGMDLRTVQRLMGHSDMESTMRYLRPAGQGSPNVADASGSRQPVGSQPKEPIRVGEE